MNKHYLREYTLKNHVLNVSAFIVFVKMKELKKLIKEFWGENYISIEDLRELTHDEISELMSNY